MAWRGFELSNPPMRDEPNASPDNKDAIRLIRQKLHDKFQWARDMGVTPGNVFDEVTARAVYKFKANVFFPMDPDEQESGHGVANLATRKRLGSYPPPVGPDLRPILFTVCGTGVPWWVGPDADAARAVEHKWRWQPCGYPAATFPMGKSVATGREQLCVDIEKNRALIEQFNLDVAFMSYSQGAVIAAECWEYDIKPEGGRLHWLKPHLVKAVAFGNPMREKGKAFSDPGGAMVGPESYGIADRLMVDTPSWWRNYAHAGDLYTDVQGESGENKTAIYKIVMGQRMLSGPDSILMQVFELLGVKPDGGQAMEMLGMVRAIMDAGMFFIKRTGPHVNYGIGPAIDFLRA